jgi:hypothetical protein
MTGHANTLLLLAPSFTVRTLTEQIFAKRPSLVEIDGRRRSWSVADSLPIENPGGLKPAGVFFYMER